MGPHNPFAWIDEADARRYLGVEQFRRAPIESAGDAVLELLGETAPSAGSRDDAGMRPPL